MALYEITSEIDFERPIMLAALSGWVDAGNAATDAAELLAQDAREVASFNPDELFDYRSNRPILDVVDGLPKEMMWPRITVHAKQLGARTLLVLTGSEPDMRWRAFSGSVVELAHRLNVTLHITLGSVPAQVPHTLPPPVLTTASDQSLLVGQTNPPPGLLRVPSAAVSVIERAMMHSGVPVVGYYAQIPHYVTPPYHPGALALLERVAAQLDTTLPVAELMDQTNSQRRQLDEIVSGRPEAKEYVRQLESMAGQENLPSGEDIAAEIERFLGQGGQGGPGDQGPFGPPQAP
jgi:hypothetical protein